VSVEELLDEETNEGTGVYTLSTELKGSASITVDLAKEGHGEHIVSTDDGFEVTDGSGVAYVTADWGTGGLFELNNGTLTYQGAELTAGFSLHIDDVITNTTKANFKDGVLTLNNAVTNLTLKLDPS